MVPIDMGHESFLKSFLPLTDEWKRKGQLGGDATHNLESRTYWKDGSGTHSTQSLRNKNI